MRKYNVYWKGDPLELWKVVEAKSPKDAFEIFLKDEETINARFVTVKWGFDGFEQFKVPHSGNEEPHQGPKIEATVELESTVELEAAKRKAVTEKINPNEETEGKSSWGLWFWLLLWLAWSLLVVIEFPVAGACLVCVPLLAFMIWMLVDCLLNQSSEGNDKLVWVFVMIFVPIIGAILYFMIMRKTRGSAPRQPLAKPMRAPISDQKNCPMCGELILAVAKKCKHCQEYIE